MPAKQESLTKDARKKILAFERKCYRKLLIIRRTQKMTNKELYEKMVRNTRCCKW